MPDSPTHPGGAGVATEDFPAAVARAVARPIWVVDRAGVIRFANPAVTVALGYADDAEVVGRRCHELVHGDDDHSDSACPMLKPRITGVTVRSEVDRFARRDGSTFPASWVSAPVDMPGGRGVVVAFSDVQARLESVPAFRDRDATLREVHDALRRVAAIAAKGASSEAVFAAIAEEVAQVTHLPNVGMFRYDGDGMVTAVGSWSVEPHIARVGSRWPLDGDSAIKRVLLTGRPARIDDYTGVQGTLAEAARASGVAQVAGAPIIVDGRVWGVMGTYSVHSPLSGDVEERLADFTGLVATAIANSHAHDELRQLADEHAALRRVATLVADGASPDEVFAAVAREATVILERPLVAVGMFRFESDGTCRVVAATDEHAFRPGTTWPLDGPSLGTRARDSGRTARVDSYASVSGTIAAAVRQAGFAAGVGAPILVDGELWGVMSACARRPGPLPADAEHRLARFTALLATAISNSQAREDLHRVADEQAARRRLATLVAEGAELQVVFDAVCEEAGRALGAASVTLARVTDDDGGSTLAAWNASGVDGAADGAVISAPVSVAARPWGALIAITDRTGRWPAEAEQWLAGFADIVGTAVSNAAARAELVASRERLVRAGDEQGRRVVRDLHDGAQQHVRGMVRTLELASKALGSTASPTTALVREALEQATNVDAELRELARGVLPTTLTHGGLRDGLAACAARASVPVTLDVPAMRFPASVEATAYFVVAEALTNVSKHARAHRAWVTVVVDHEALSVRVRDDGVGGAQATGHGLLGLQDRVAALEGRLQVESPRGGGTLVTAAIPLPA